MGAGIRLGTNLKVLMNRLGLTLKQLSHETGIPYTTLHTWLESRQPRDVVKVKILAEHFHLSLDELLFTNLNLQPDERGGDATTFRSRLEGLGGTPSQIEGEYQITIRRLPAGYRSER